MPTSFLVSTSYCKVEYAARFIQLEERDATKPLLARSGAADFQCRPGTRLVPQVEEQPSQPSDEGTEPGYRVTLLQSLAPAC